MKKAYEWIKNKVTAPVRIGLGLALVAVLAWLFFLYVVSSQRNEGVLPSETQPETATESREEKYLDHNVVTIRNEVFVVNGEDVKVEDLRPLLQRLQANNPDAVIELKLSEDEREPAGMVQTLKEAVEASRLKLQM